MLIKQLLKQHATFVSLIQSDSNRCVETAKTTKSSCVNARGIPTAAYQVLHLLTEFGYPPAGVPPAKSNGGYPRWGTPPSRSTPGRVTPWLGPMGGTRGGIPQNGYPLARSNGGIPKVGYPPAEVPPARSDGMVPEVGYPHGQVQWEGTWGGLPPPRQGYHPTSPKPGRGTPIWTWLGYPPRWYGQREWWTDACQNITFPRTTCTVGKYQLLVSHTRGNQSRLFLLISHLVVAAKMC